MTKEYKEAKKQAKKNQEIRANKKWKLKALFII
jgi:hypothetical protein